MSQSIKTNFEFPRQDNLDTQGKRLAQDLSLNFKRIRSIVDSLQEAQTASSVNPYGLDGEEVAFAYSISGLTGSQQNYFSSYSPSHTLGSIPSGYIVTDVTVSGQSSSGMSLPVINRTSWTNTTATFIIGSTCLGTSGTVSGTIKILLLR